MSWVGLKYNIALIIIASNTVVLPLSSGQPLPAEMTLAQLLTLLYDRKLPQGYRSIDLTVKLGSKVISDPGLSKTDSFKRLRTEKGTGRFYEWMSEWLLCFLSCCIGGPSHMKLPDTITGLLGRGASVCVLGGNPSEAKFVKRIFIASWIKVHLLDHGF